jgi:hypothetical protein
MMKVVMTLLVRDEVDIVDAQLRYHFERGIDFVVATDNRSVDGTTEVLARYEREGRLHLIRESGVIRQSEWVTRMARLAAEELGADWVINADVDEFWWPRQGSIRETLAAVPAHFGVVRGLMRHFVPRPGADEPFFERMIVRHPSVPSRFDLYNANVKVAHRAVRDVEVTGGNHDAYGEGLALLRQWFPFEVLHFPVRSVAQMQAKFSRREDGEHAGPHAGGIRRAIASEGPEEVFARYLVDDDALTEGMAAGSLAIDVRLRDSLRHGMALALASTTVSERFEPESELEAERAFVADVGAFMESDSAVALRRRADELDHRLAALELPLGAGVSPAQALRRVVTRARSRTGRPNDASHRPTTGTIHTARPALAGKQRPRVVIAAVTVAVSLFLLFALMPELLGDWPYNAFGKNSRTHASRPHPHSLNDLAFAPG